MNSVHRLTTDRCLGHIVSSSIIITPDRAIDTKCGRLQSYVRDDTRYLVSVELH